MTGAKKIEILPFGLLEKHSVQRYFNANLASINNIYVITLNVI